MSSSTLEVLSTVVIVVGALAVIVIRLQAAKKPTSIKKIIMPPIGMSTGFLMFISPLFRMPWTYALMAFLAGCVLSLPLIATSHMQSQDGDIYLKRSPAFILVLLGLLIVRLFLHTYLQRFITIPQTGGLFFILAFGMILPWRVAMLLRYRAFTQKVEVLRLSKSNG